MILRGGMKTALNRNHGWDGYRVRDLFVDEVNVETKILS